MLPWIASKADNLGARRDQQDRVAVLANPQQRECLIVCSDGVGGQEGGALASQAVVDTATKLWRAKNGRPVAPRDFLMQLCQFSHKEIVRIGKQQDAAPRATIAAVYVTDGEACWVHSGDSRVYQFRDRTLVSRSRDHSVLQILVERGAVKEEEMGTHPDQGKLLQSLGGDEFKPPTFGGAKTGPGDAFLVCSDGFWEPISPEEAGMMITSGRELPRQLKYFVDLAAKRGGPKGDNVSAAALAIGGKRSVLDLFRRDPRTVMSVALAVVALAIIVMVISWLVPQKSTGGSQQSGDGTSSGSGRSGTGVPSDFSNVSVKGDGTIEKSKPPAPANDKSASGTQSVEGASNQATPVPTTPVQPSNQDELKTMQVPTPSPTAIPARDNRDHKKDKTGKEDSKKGATVANDPNWKSDVAPKDPFTKTQ